MMMSNTFFNTKREYPSDEETISNKLLVKSGMIHKNDDSTYSYMPIGLKVLNNIKNIIKEEMFNINSSEVLIPIDKELTNLKF